MITIRTEIRRWHTDVLATYAADMYNTLLYEYDLVTDTMKEIEFTDKFGVPLMPMRGFFAKKDMRKYWIGEELVSAMPIRLGTEFEELKYNEDVVFRPLRPQPFKIKPALKINPREFIDSFVPFKHSNPDNWLIMKFISVMGYIGRTYTTQSSNPAFGKSSCYDTLHYLTDKNPVFQPRSVPGVLNNLNVTGNIVFDEVHKCKKEVREIMENLSLMVGGGKSVYINGALKATNTKQRYDCRLQSITYIYNTLDCYSDSNDFFDNGVWINAKAMDDRFLKFKLTGRLEEEFDKDFDIPATALENKQFYIDFTKTLLYLQNLRLTNGYAKRYNANNNLNVKGRKRLIYNEILWLIDMYSNSQQEFDRIVSVLDKSIIDYLAMVNCYEFTKVTEERVL